jgi:citrate lyase subunit beta / citryl-CoA lyase
MYLLPRTLLFVPADRPDRFDKAVASGADAVILDLEDAVAPAAKGQARDAVANWLSPERGVLVRINGAQTPWFQDDLAMALAPGVTGIVLPKVEGMDEVLVAACVAAGKSVLPMIESAAGLSNVALIALATGVQRLIFGSLDFQLDLGIDGDELELLAYRSQLVLASRVTGLAAPVDGVSTVLHDPESLRASALRARRQGFGGKLCIHPGQVGVVNAAFGPSEQELSWARRVLQAAGGSQGAAVAVDGAMVDRPLILKAQAMLAQSHQRTGQVANATR